MLGIKTTGCSWASHLLLPSEAGNGNPLLKNVIEGTQTQKYSSQRKRVVTVIIFENESIP